MRAKASLSSFFAFVIWVIVLPSFLVWFSLSFATWFVSASTRAFCWSACVCLALDSSWFVLSTRSASCFWCSRVACRFARFELRLKFSRSSCCILRISTEGVGENASSRYTGRVGESSPRGARSCLAPCLGDFSELAPPPLEILLRLSCFFRLLISPSFVATSSLRASASIFRTSLVRWSAEILLACSVFTFCWFLAAASWAAATKMVESLLVFSTWRATCCF
mmetsp:Transcript_5962/g.12364  ORF Transcript_5962/g.12364 Transcript_5962/m.12364 type:complete len:223 (-) Transcript_5962:630-1298(-)